MTVTHERQLITTRDEFVDALRGGFERLQASGCREAWMCDDDFAEWPLDEPPVLDALAKWSLPHRKLTVIARDYDVLARRHPRWVQYRRQWSHVVDCRTPDSSLEGTLPIVFLGDRTFVVRLAHPEQYRGVATTAPGDLVSSRETIDAIAQRSDPGFPATVLGL